MKSASRLLVLVVVLLGLSWAQASAQAQPVGAYFTLVNTYIYAKGPREGRRVLVHPRQAFDVLDVTVDNQDRLWLLIVYPADSAKLEGTGWTATPPHELLTPQQDPVLVFSRIPDDASGPLEIFRVPTDGLELLNETQSNTPFAQIDWQKVHYKYERPQRLWARGGAGIYRPGKTAAFMSRVYAELVTRNVDKDEQTRLLSGVVRIGDTLRDVRWALGDALRAQEETIGDAQRTSWQYPEMTVTFENGVVKQIN